MTKQITAFFKWVFLSGNFRVYPVNFLKLQWLWFWKIVRWFCWIVNVGINYIKNPNILTLLVVLALAWVSGWFYAYYGSVDCRMIESSQKTKSVVVPQNSGQENRTGAIANGPTEISPGQAEKGVNRTLMYRIKAKINTPEWGKRLVAVKWCLQAMFDVSFAFSHFNSGVGLWGIVDGVVALGLFLFTWLIGGGALISSIITTMHENHHGAWRKWKCLLWNHTLIIGWDDNGPTVIREHLESRRIPLIRTPWGTWEPKRPERIVVITAGDAYEISKVVKLAIGNWVQRLRITFDVYQGTYDAVYERKRLALNRANAVYVLGDEGEPAHDARVSLWPTLASHFGSVQAVENKEPLRCAINVEDYGLFCQRQRKGLQCLGHAGQSFFLDDTTRPIDISTYNFYDSWAKRLLARLPLVRSRHGTDSVSASRVTVWDCKFEYAHVVIIGLSEMGRAILAELLRDCHYASDKSTRITIMDENVQERRLEFKSIYPRCEEVPDISISWNEVSKLGAKDFVKEVGGFMGAKNCQLTVIVAHDDPSVTMRIALPIMNKAFDLNACVRMLIRQGVKGLYGDRRVTNITIGGSSGMLTVFGMRDGAGFGMWKRDVIAKKMAASQGGYWYALPTRGKQYCRQFIDALGQVLAGLGLVICDWLPSLSDKNYKSAFEDENFGTAEGLLDALLGISKGRDFLKAMHKHWCSCYLLSDDGNGIMETALDYRLVSFEELERDKSRKGLLALAKELFDLLTALRGCGLHVVDRKDSCHAK